MKKKGMLALLITVVLIIASCLIFIILVGSNKSLEKQESLSYKTLGDIKTKKLKEAFKQVLDKKNGEFEIEFDENELNELIYQVVKTCEENQKDLRIRGYRAEINNDRIKISLDSYLFKLLPVQYIFEIIPSIEDNKVSLFITSFKIGRLSVGSETVLRKLKLTEKNDYYIDLQKRSIVLINKYPKQIILKSVEVNGQKIGIKITLSISSIKDMINMLDMF